jgi:hypothetical protein
MTEMKYSILAATVAVITFAGIGTAMVAGPARAATASSFHICLLNSPTRECLESNGEGNQVSMTSNDAASFTILRTGSYGQYTAYQFENAAGNCLRAGDGGIVKIENGGCSGKADWWALEGPNADELVSEEYNFPMITGDASGDLVYWGAFHSGDWDQWTFN